MKARPGTFRSFRTLPQTLLPALVAVGVFLSGCLVPEDERHGGASVGCGNPPAPAACAEGNTLAEVNRVGTDPCPNFECGAGIPYLGSLEFGMDLKLRISAPPQLTLPIRYPLSVRVVIYSGDGNAPGSAALDTVDFMLSDPLLSIPSSTFRFAAEKYAARFHGDDRPVKGVLLNLQIGVAAAAEAGGRVSWKFHLLEGVAFGPLERKAENDPDHVWPGLLGKWPVDTLIRFDDDSSYTLSGRLDWAPDESRVGSPFQIFWGVTGSPYWKRYSGGMDTLFLPGSTYALQAWAEGPLGMQVVPLQSGVDSLPMGNGRVFSADE